MRFVDTYLSILSDSPWVTITLGLIGLFLFTTSLWLLRRRRKHRDLSQSRVSVIVVAFLFGVFLCGVAGYVIARWPPGFQLLVADDFSDPSMVAALGTDSLEALVDALPGVWPQLRGPRRDGITKDAGIRLDWQNAPPKVVWRQPFAAGYSSIAVVGDRVYTQDKEGSHERVLCLAADSGKTVWSYSYPVDYAGFRSHNTGPRATPTVHDGRVYAVGATGKFFCLDANPADGQAKLLWQHDLMSEFAAPLPPWGFACSPLIEGKHVIVLPGGDKGAIAAFDRVSGVLAWEKLDDLAGYSSPIAATLAGTRQIIAFTGYGLAGLRPEDGSKLWYFDWRTSYEANVATPIVAGNYVFISSDYNKGCALLKVSKADGGALKADPVYVRQNKLMRNHQSTCVLHEGHLYGMDTRGSGARVALRCVDFRSGQEKWSTDDVGKAVPLLADNHLLLLFETGELVLAAANPESYQEKGKFKVFTGESEVWALPALANGRLYLRSHKEIVCVDVKK